MDADVIEGWSVAAMERRIVRYADLVPCYNAFIDTRTPGSEAKENFTIIGPGVSENPEQHVHIAEPHGFNIGGARQPPNCVNSQHSHDTAEVFVAHSGHWRFDLGEHGDDAQVALAPGDVISLPTRTFRGFTATAPADDGSPGFLWAVLGQDNPGRVTWAPDVFAMARDYGLVLLESGRLIDTAAGETLPAGARAMPATTAEQVGALARLSQDRAETLVARAPRDGLPGGTRLIGRGAALAWPHGFTLDRLELAPGEGGAPLAVDTVEVLFVHRGEITMTWPDGETVLREGDTVTVPVGLERAYASTAGAIGFVVRGAED